MNPFECGCERGGDCTKTTVCQSNDAISELQDRITELEKAKKRLIKTHHRNLREWKKDKERIEELEAENRIFRQTESVDDSVWDALLEQIRQHQAGE